MTDTERETADRTPHPAKEGDSAPNASERGPARAKDSPRTALTQRDTWERVGRGLVPPQVWAEQRPSLADMWRYAAYGAYTSQTGVVRGLGKAYALLALAITAIAYYLAWLCERPSRLVAACVLAGVVYLAAPHLIADLGGFS